MHVVIAFTCTRMGLDKSTVNAKPVERVKGVDPKVYWVGRGQKGDTDAVVIVGATNASALKNEKGAR